MHFGFALELSNVDLLNIDLLDTHLDLLDKDIPSILLVSIMSSRCLQDMLSSSRCLQDVLEDAKLLLWRRVEDVFKTCLGDVFKTSSRLTNVCWVNIILESPYLGKIISRGLNYVSIKMASIKLLQDCFMTES